MVGRLDGARPALRASATRTNPTYENGGYDVRSYDLEVTYDPATDVLDGRAEIRARATQSLCSFNLDLDG
jgi:hypothetical protein